MQPKSVLIESKRATLPRAETGSRAIASSGTEPTKAYVMEGARRTDSVAHITLRNAFLAALIALPVSAGITLTAPVAGTSISGPVSFTAAVASLPATTTVDYWIAGHSVVSGALPMNAPYSKTVDTTALFDGPVQFVAVARDASGTVLATSAPVNVTINNFMAAHTTQIAITEPANLSRALSGTVKFHGTSSDSRNVQSLIWIVDGKQTVHTGNYGPSAADDFTLDTATLANGLHYLALQMVPYDPGDGHAPSYGAANVITQFTTSNAAAPIELRTNLRSVYFRPGKTLPVQLSARMIHTNGTSTAVTASFTSDAPSIASVSSSGLVTPHAQGLAHITVTTGGKSTSVLVTNVTTHSGFPHFSKTGQILYKYTPSSSIFVRTLFFTPASVAYTYAQSEHITTAGYAAALKDAGVNAITSPFYRNPSDSGDSSLAEFVARSGPIQQSWIDFAKNNGLGIVGTGDDLGRNGNEMNYSLNRNGVCPWCADAIRYSLAQLVASKNTISLEMQDETGGNPVDADHISLMSIVNSVPNRPKVTWPPAGLQGSGSPADPAVFRAWMGDPAMSDYGSMYWTYPYNFRPAFSWGQSLSQTKDVFDRDILVKMGGLQLDKPKYLLVQATGPLYFKRVPGDHYHPTQDELMMVGQPSENTTAQILYAAAMGFAGVRIYGYDGADPASNDGLIDGLWAFRRGHDPYDDTNRAEQQNGASPYGNLPEAADRWTAVSNALNLIQNLEPYMVSPQMNAPDLGACIVTGARQALAGRMLIAVNMCDVAANLKADVNPYRYPGASTVVQFRVSGMVSSSSTVENTSTMSPTLAPGETVVYTFSRPTTVQSAGEKK